MLAVPLATTSDSGHLPLCHQGMQASLLGRLTCCTKVLTIKVKYKGLGFSKAVTIYHQLEV